MKRSHDSLSNYFMRLMDMNTQSAPGSAGAVQLCAFAR